MMVYTLTIGRIVVKVLPIFFAPNHPVPLLARFGKNHRLAALRFAVGDKLRYTFDRAIGSKR